MSIHAKISYIKSFVRIFGFIFLISQEFFSAAAILIIAEIIGIAEEIYENK